MSPHKILNLSQSLLAILLLVTCSSDEIPQNAPTIVIGAPLSIEVFDIGNTGNSSDLRIFYSPGQNSQQIEEYKIIISKVGSVPNLDVETALTLPSGSFFPLASSSTLPRFNLNDGVTDSDGETVQNEIEYILYMLAIPLGSDGEAKLSPASEEFMMTDKELRDLYISSRTTNSVELFDGVTGERIRSFVLPGSGQISAPQEVIFLDDGSLIVTARFNSAIKRFNGSTGEFISNFTFGYDLDQPTKTNIGPDGYLYVSQWGDVQNSIVRFDLSTGEFVDEVVDTFFQGMDHAWDTNGNMYVVSFGLKELRKYDPQFNQEYVSTSQLTGPVNVWLDDNILYIVDWEDGTVKRYSSDGGYMDTFISGLTKAEGFTFDDGKLMLCDWQDNKVNIYDLSDGSLIITFIESDKIQQPNSITFGPDHRPV